MKIQTPHTWQLDTREAQKIQSELAPKLIFKNIGINPNLIAGADVSVTRFGKIGRAALVLLDFHTLEMVETSTAEGEINFPYIPGLLSFREAPLIMQAFHKLSHIPDVVIVDGQGIAHPRRFGIASHLGLSLDIPTIGCAKSRLIGSYSEVPDRVGAFSFLYEGDEIIGAVVRTRQGIKPVYVSIGHKIDLLTAISCVLNCCRGLRLPEPTRLAHLLANNRLGNLKR